MKSSVFGRSVKLVGLASKLAKSELGRSVRSKIKNKVEDLAPDLLNTRIEQANMLVENLSQLKGAAMKVGQLLSLDSSDVLPPEVTEILSKLQNSAEPVDFMVLDKVLREEIPVEEYCELQDLEVKAYASASIGQVHRANYYGQEIVLKIQYPGVVNSIDSDIAILKKVVQSYLVVSGRKMEMNEVFEEFRQRLHSEADYQLEKENLKKYGEFIASDDRFFVPQVIEKICTKNVLGMSFLEGETLGQWLMTHPNEQDKLFVGQSILDLYCKEFFQWGFVQTDPNYANFLIQKNPMKIGLLDFGAAISYTPEFRAQYVEFLKSLGTMDRKKILNAALEFQLIDSRESDEAKANFVDFMINAIEPFFPGNQPFQFNDSNYGKRAMRLGRRFTTSLKYSPPPKQIMFLHRKLGGIFNLMRKLELEMNLEPYWQKMVGNAVKTEGF